jgi:ABC-2 type transport system permease protein
MRIALKTIYTIWLREVKTFGRERFRVIAMIAQPLLYLLVLGNGINSGVTLNANGGISYLTFMYPGIIAMSILFTSIFSAVSIVWDREFGFLKEVLVAPVPRWAVAIGKTFGGATIAIVQATTMILMAPLIGISLSPRMIVTMWVLAFLIGVALTSLGIAIDLRYPCCDDRRNGFNCNRRVPVQQSKRVVNVSRIDVISSGRNQTIEEDTATGVFRGNGSFL